MPLDCNLGVDKLWRADLLPRHHYPAEGRAAECWVGSESDDGKTATTIVHIWVGVLRRGGLLGSSPFHRLVARATQGPAHRPSCSDCRAPRCPARKGPLGKVPLADDTARDNEHTLSRVRDEAGRVLRTDRLIPRAWHVDRPGNVEGRALGAPQM